MSPVIRNICISWYICIFVMRNCPETEHGHLVRGKFNWTIPQRFLQKSLDIKYPHNSTTQHFKNLKCFIHPFLSWIIQTNYKINMCTKYTFKHIVISYIALCTWWTCHSSKYNLSGLSKNTLYQLHVVSWGHSSEGTFQWGDIPVRGHSSEGTFQWGDIPVRGH